MLHPPLLFCFSTGDSGGPLSTVTSNADGSETHTIVGITSWGYGGCAAENYPTVYASTSGVAEWIKTTVCDTWGVDASFCPKAPKGGKAAKKGKKGKKAKKECKATRAATFEVITDIFAFESTWYLQNDATGEITARMDASEFTDPNEIYPVEVELCSGESYTSFLADSFGDGQKHEYCILCDPPPGVFWVQFEDTIIFQVGDWDGYEIASNPIVLSSTGTDCDLEIDINVITDQWPYETFYSVEEAAGTVILQTSPGDFTEEYSLYLDMTVTGLCPGVEYIFVLYDDFGDGTNIPPYCLEEPNPCPEPGMIGTLSTGEVLFDALGNWDGYSLSETFVVN